jgi:hypothetical protein
VEAGSPRDLTHRLQGLVERGVVIRSVAPEAATLRERYRHGISSKSTSAVGGAKAAGGKGGRA